MPFVEYHQRLYALHEGENRVGRDPECDVRLPNLPPGEELRIVVQGDEAFVEGADRPTRVNGRPVNGDPAPLRDQDRLEVGDTAILYVDERARGERQPAGPDRRRGSGGSDAGVAPAGRKPGTVPVLTRLDDGAVYVLDRTGLKIGREKNCDIVIPDRSVSRLHAEITLEGNRYILHDLSRNGTLVNGEKARSNPSLRVGDVIGIGNYELRLSRRPAAAVKGVQDHVTPVRAAVPDAPTVQVRRPDDSSVWGPVVLRWSLILALAGMAAFALLAR